mmetsp:Transcript_54033/g.145731  ORF Transcript_54033/g.145731 Transcript_54033/m.145731 type:complete len:238 (+) Transcript_54033:86-799(+)
MAMETHSAAPHHSAPSCTSNSGVWCILTCRVPCSISSGSGSKAGSIRKGASGLLPTKKKAPGFLDRKKEKSSPAMFGVGGPTDRPLMLRPAASTASAHAASFTQAGKPSEYFTAMLHSGPCEAARPCATSWIRRRTVLLTAAVYVRTVPSICTLSASTFGANPPSILPRLMTALSVGDMLRLTTACRLVTNCAATTMASTVPCGADACPPLPCTVSWMESLLAVTDPGAQPRVPAEE